ncbi:unnamed protein product [Camellia sinensis]
MNHCCYSLYKKGYRDSLQFNSDTARVPSLSSEMVLRVRDLPSNLHCKPNHSFSNSSTSSKASASRSEPPTNPTTTVGKFGKSFHSPAGPRATPFEEITRVSCCLYRVRDYNLEACPDLPRQAPLKSGLAQQGRIKPTQSN